MIWSIHSGPTSPSRCFIDKWKNTPSIWLFLQRKIFGTKFGSFCTIQKRFDQNWITNSIAVRVYFWALFANLDFPNSLLAPLCNVILFSHWWGLHRFDTILLIPLSAAMRRALGLIHWKAGSSPAHILKRLEWVDSIAVCSIQCNIMHLNPHQFEVLLWIANTQMKNNSIKLIFTEVDLSAP